MKNVYRQKLKIEKTKDRIQNIGKILSSRDSYNSAMAFWDEDSLPITESMYALFLNKSNTPIAWALLSTGGIDGTVCDIRLVFSHAVLCAATSLILFHNHPSGNLKPSQQDISLTTKIKQAGEIMGVTLLDHIIVSEENGYYSFTDEGMM